ncbi:MAG: T9SS type A sorting domain-containing protein [Ferruginibacter sp.]
MKQYKLILIIAILFSCNISYSSGLNFKAQYNNTAPGGIISFKAALVNNSQILLSWNTAVGITNSGFDVERQDASGVWQKIGFVKSGYDDRSNTGYEFTDAAPLKGSNYYRLKFTNPDGSFGYTDNVMLEYRKSMLGYSFQNYPNPFTTSTTIRYEVLTKGQVRIAVFDMNGTEVELLVNRIDEPGIHTVQWNAFRNQPGTYIYRIITQDDNITQTMIKH